VIKLVRDYVLIKPFEKGERQVSGIILPGYDKNALLEGKIISVGKGRLLDNGTIIDLDVKENDIVLYRRGPYEISEIVIEGETHLIMSQMNIIGTKED
jgi:chaperonin GroES